MTISKFLLLCSILFISFAGYAQTYTKKTVYSGESIVDKSYFLFPSFENAAVKMKNGGSMVYKMNFNLLICAMQFIDTNNDTLVIAKPAEVDTITLNDQQFYFNDGYYQVLTNTDSAKLVVLRTASYDALKIGALGLPSHSGSGIQSYSTLETYLGERKLTVNEDVEVTDETNYFLINNSGEKIKADKAGFIKFFPAKASSISSYLKQNNIKFSKAPDLIKLFNYCIH